MKINNLGAVKAEGGCSIDTSVLEPRPFHKGFIFKGCNAQTDESNMVPNGTSCREVMCKQFKFSSVKDVTCIDGQWSALPNCFKGCPAPVSKAGMYYLRRLNPDYIRFCNHFQACCN